MRHSQERSRLPRIITLTMVSICIMWMKEVAEYPHAITHEIEDASHFLQEDAPERIVAWIEAFLEANP